METFSKQLARLYKRQMESYGTLPPVANPIKRKPSIAWITTPVAACIGLIIGLSVHNHIESFVSKEQVQTNVAATISLPEYCYTINPYPIIHLSEICIIPKN